MGLTILIADDDEAFRREMTRLLRFERAVTIFQARDGEQAVHVAREARPDVVLMDLAMPGMGGLEATRRIKAEQPDIKIIVLTVYDEEAYRKAARECGADGFVRKTVAVLALIPSISQLVPEFGVTATSGDPSK